MKEAVQHEYIVPEKRIVLYEYSELSESAKDKVKQDYLRVELEGGFRANELTDLFKHSFLEYFFPNSDLDVDWDLSYRQGDIVSIYGNIQWTDMVNYVKNYNLDEHKGRPLYHHWTFTEDEDDLLNDYTTYLPIEITRNSHYGSIYDGYFYGDWVFELEDNNIALSDYKLIHRLDTVVCSALASLTSEMKNFGYEFLYEVSDEEMQDMSDCNDWLYTEDGCRFDDWYDELLEKAV